MFHCANFCDDVRWYEDEFSAKVVQHDKKIIFTDIFNSFPGAEFVTGFHNIPHILLSDKCIQSFGVGT